MRELPLTGAPRRPASVPASRPDHVILVVPQDAPEAQGRRRAAFHRVERVVNVTLALLAVLITLPLWIAIAVAIKLTSRGPVFYSQVRVGLDVRRSNPNREDPRRRQDLGGRPFKIYKFRTMAVDAEQASGPVWAARSDPRVTSFGRVLRQYRLDELPQLLNVIRGEMNIVGPRPERPVIFAELRRQIPGYSQRQRAMPGITGHAQINQHYDACVEDVRTKLQYDLEYIERRSLFEDLKIMLKTAPVVLLRKGGW